MSEDLAGQEWVLHLIGDEVAVLMAVLLDWANTHEDDKDPETQRMIEKLKTMRPVRAK